MCPDKSGREDGIKVEEEDISIPNHLPREQILQPLKDVSESEWSERTKVNSAIQVCLEILEEEEKGKEGRYGINAAPASVYKVSIDSSIKNKKIPFPDLLWIRRN